MASLTPFLNLTTVGLFLLLAFSYYILKRSKPVKGKTVPEAKGGWPLIGHILLFRGPKLPHLTLTDLVDKYGPIFTIRIGIYPAVVVSSWEMVKEIFTTHDSIVSSRPRLTSMKLLGHDFANFGFSPYGAYWRALRKITASELMSNRRLELLKHVRTSEVDMAVKDMYKLCVSNGNEGLVEMKQWFNSINLNVILRMVVGKRYFGAGADEHEAKQFQKANREFFRLSRVFVVRDAIPWLGWLDIGGYEKAMKKTAKEVDVIMQKLLEEHRSCRRNRDSCEASDQEEQDFMDVLLTALDGIDLAGYDLDTVHKATSLTIISGASDTTTVNITWAIALLLNNPSSLRKVQEELDLHIGKERLATESDLKNLVYLQAVIKETMRLFPAGPLSGPRIFTEDTVVFGYKIPAGTRLIVNTHKLQRDPRVWSEPTEFKPERFLSSTHQGVDVKGQHFELIPFGAGRRSCPGISFGVLMTQLLLARFLQAFEVSRCSSEAVDMTGSAGLSNNMANPLHVVVKPRLPSILYH